MWCEYFVCQTHTTRMQPHTIMSEQWHGRKFVRGGVFLRTPLQRLISILSRLNLNLLKHPDTYYPSMRIKYRAHTAGLSSLKVLPKILKFLTIYIMPGSGVTQGHRLRSMLWDDILSIDTEVSELNSLIQKWDEEDSCYRCRWWVMVPLETCRIVSKQNKHCNIASC
jgi:hypothetical protein